MGKLCYLVYVFIDKKYPEVELTGSQEVCLSSVTVER